MITNPAEYKVGLYIRLSDEDDGIETQSESVVNQQKILNEFARRERLRVVDTYIDDGWTGTNFDGRVSRGWFATLRRDGLIWSSPRTYPALAVTILPLGITWSAISRSIVCAT